MELAGEGAIGRRDRPVGRAAGDAEDLVRIVAGLLGHRSPASVARPGEGQSTDRAPVVRPAPDRLRPWASRAASPSSTSSTATASRSIPPCADPGFDHRSCDYWEDADRGSKAARLDWLEAHPARAAEPPRAGRQPVPGRPRGAVRQPVRAARRRWRGGQSVPARRRRPVADNPFAPRRPSRAGVGDDAPRKLRLLGRGLGVAGSYAKVLLVDDEPAAYCQFGPLTAYPRAQRTRDLYPALPEAPLPAVITCIATTAEARGQGLARRLVEAICDDLGGAGFAAVETYPEVGARPDATSAATPGVLAGARVRGGGRRRALPGPALDARVRRRRAASSSRVLAGGHASRRGVRRPGAEPVRESATRVPARRRCSATPVPADGLGRRRCDAARRPARRPSPGSSDAADAETAAEIAASPGAGRLASRPWPSPCTSGR